MDSVSLLLVAGMPPAGLINGNAARALLTNMTKLGILNVRPRSNPDTNIPRCVIARMRVAFCTTFASKERDL